MIFVTVGTGSFDSLVRAMDKLALGDVVIQTGSGRYVPKNCKHFDYKKSLTSDFKKAKIVVTHGGAGTLLELAGMNKRVVAVTNPESVHNPDIVMKLSQEKHILWCESMQSLGTYIKRAGFEKFKKYSAPKCTIQNEIKRFLK